MLHFGTILFPIDSAARSIATAPYVAALADRFGSRVLTLHVGESRAPGEMLVVGRVRRMIGAERSRHITMAGDPAEAIASAARREQVDVIVMPTRGVSPLRRLWAPSITAAVLAAVRCPVITCTDAWERWANREISTVLCATALGPQSGRVLHWAAQLAKSVTADLAVVHADARLQSSPGYACDGEWRLWIRRNVRDQLKHAVRDAGAEGADLWIEGDKPAAAIAQVAGQLSADLVVVGRSTTAGLFGRDRTRCYDIARHALCPVAIV